MVALERWSFWKGGRFIGVVFKTGLTIVKREVIDKVLKAFDGIKKNLKFTVDKFENKAPHFLDLEICINDIKFFFKKTPTLDSTLIWTPLLCGNGKRTGFDHLLIKQRKCVQKKTFQKNFNQKEISNLEWLS